MKLETPQTAVLQSPALSELNSPATPTVPTVTTVPPVPDTAPPMPSVPTVPLVPLVPLVPMVPLVPTVPTVPPLPLDAAPSPAASETLPPVSPSPEAVPPKKRRASVRKPAANSPAPEIALGGDSPNSLVESARKAVPAGGAAATSVTGDDLRSAILAARKSPEQVAAMVATKKEIVSAPIVKSPPKGKYFRVRGTGEWHYRENAFLMFPADFGNDRRDYLLIHPSIEEFVSSKRQLRSSARLCGLAFIVDAHGQPAFWALNLDDSGNWGLSARAIAEKLTDEWGMVCADTSCYVLEVPEDCMGEPLWPEGDPAHWLELAFKDRIVDSQDHPEIKKLLGRK